MSAIVVGRIRIAIVPAFVMGISRALVVAAMRRCVVPATVVRTRTSGAVLGKSRNAREKEHDCQN